MTMLSPLPLEDPLRVASNGTGAHLRVSVAGELDLMTVPTLAEELDRFGVQDRPIEIDLAGLTFMDCSGLQPFLAAARRAGEQGQGFTIINACRAVRRVFELTENGHLLAGPPPLEVAHA
jgi:anti-sigma B factor antagonist